jgi:hypothetical protein
MWRIAAIVIGLSLAIGSQAGDAKKPAKPKIAGYFKVTFEAKGVLKLTFDEKTRLITGVGLDGGGSLFGMTLDKNQALHETARKLDGKLVMVTGDGHETWHPPTGLSMGEKGMNYIITAIRPAEEKK